MAAINSSTPIFLLLTLAYSILKYYTKSPTGLKIWTIVYFLLVLIILFFVNLSLTNEMCGFSQFSIALKATLFPWVIIFGSMFVILKAFPLWLSPFSNTIGYFFAYISGVNNLLSSILKDPSTLNLSSEHASIVKAINYIYEDKSLTINDITLDNFESWWDRMGKGGLLKSENNTTYKAELYSYIEMKTVISEFIWYALTGLFTISISNNIVINSGCSQSAEEMEKRHNDYLEKENQIAENNKNTADNQIVYKTYD